MKALITGASRGIGFAIAQELLRRDFQCLLTAKDISRLEKAISQLSKERDESPLFLASDLLDTDGADRIVEFARRKNFTPDVLVLDAGIFFEGKLLGAPIDELTKTLQVNLVASVQLVQKFSKHLAKSKFGRVVLIGSTASLEPYAYGPYYGISKWGVRGLATNLRNELKADGVGVTLITPGGTWTDLWAGEDLPADRLLLPSDIGKLVGSLFDLSPQAVVEEIIVRPMLGDMHE